MNDPNKKLPSLPASLLAGTTGITSNEVPPPAERKQIGLPGSKREEMERKMQALRMQHAFQELHFVATDISEPEDKRIAAAQQLAMGMNRHFETIIWALRVAGGARKP